MVEKISVNNLLKKGIAYLGQGDYFNPLLDAQILLMFLLDVDKIYLYTHGAEEVTEEIAEEFMKLIKLRASRYPLQYIIGSQEFMGLDFKVREGVLVPRPDTEVLVEKIIEIVNDGYFDGKDNINIVDIGTGSGAITLSLAHYIKNSSLYSVDISPIALEVAKENASVHLLEDRVKFLKGNMLEPLYAENLQGKVDILVSNPPYIATSVIEKLQIEVSTYEPKLALDGGADGLDFYRQIVNAANDFLSERGILAFEIGYDQGEDVCNLLHQSGNFKHVELFTDLSGMDRVVIGQKA